MKYTHNDYLNYELPEDWCAEYTDENLNIYNPNGKGAMTLSFYSIIETDKRLYEQIGIMGKKFIDQNKINLQGAFLVYGTENIKMTLSGTGTTLDNWFIKIWIVAKKNKVVFITYQSQKKTSELKICDKIVESMTFAF